VPLLLLLLLICDNDNIIPLANLGALFNRLASVAQKAVIDGGGCVIVEELQNWVGLDIGSGCKIEEMRDVTSQVPTRAMSDRQ
jgi:hypothetical protein